MHIEYYFFPPIFAEAAGHKQAIPCHLFLFMLNRGLELLYPFIFTKFFWGRKFLKKIKEERKLENEIIQTILTNF